MIAMFGGAVILILVLIFYALLAWFFVRIVRRQKGPVQRALVVFGVLFFFDGLLVGQGAFTLFIAALAILTQFALAGWRAVKREKGRALAHLGAAFVYLLTIGTVWGYIAVNAYLASRTAEAVIAACRGYEARHGRLPEKLDELVPGILPRVPRARYTLAYGAFRYSLIRPGAPADASTAPTTHTLEYVFLPPFGRHRYLFEEKAWIRVD